MKQLYQYIYRNMFKVNETRCFQSKKERESFKVAPALLYFIYSVSNGGTSKPR